MTSANKNRQFWTQFYGQDHLGNSGNIQNGSTFAQFVWQTYLQPRNMANEKLTLLDLGCGNCRDTKFFAGHGNFCIGVDYNGILRFGTETIQEKQVQLNNGNAGKAVQNETLLHDCQSFVRANCSFVKEGAEEYLTKLLQRLGEYSMTDNKFPPNDAFSSCSVVPDVIYMRWFLHALPFPESEKVFLLAAEVLRRTQLLKEMQQGDHSGMSSKKGLVCIEVRSENDEDLLLTGSFQDDGSHLTTHRRWLYSKERCIRLAEISGLQILHLQEGRFSPCHRAESSDPLLLRFVCSIAETKM